MLTEAIAGLTAGHKAHTYGESVDIAKDEVAWAKSGITSIRTIRAKQEYCIRWYTAVMPLLKYYYGTGGDMNVDEIHEVIPHTEDGRYMASTGGSIYGSTINRPNHRK